MPIVAVAVGAPRQSIQLPTLQRSQFNRICNKNRESVLFAYVIT